jgi:putative glutathione S-transferase
MIFRVLKKLEGVVSMSAVEPLMLDKGWTFAAPDPLTGAHYVHQIYQRADPGYSGRASVPVLWDKETNTIVNNESSEIIRMFNREFRAFTDDRTDYYPAELAAEIGAVNRRVYEGFNNGVYRAGFATTQTAYETAVKTVFETLDWLEARLSKSRYLVGDRLTEADWRLFPTLARFDAVYFARLLYETPGIAQTCDFDEYKLHYYGSHRTINPTGIVPLGPLKDFRNSG